MKYNVPSVSWGWRKSRAESSDSILFAVALAIDPRRYLGLHLVRDGC
jgi:hypothetical protein